MTTIVLSYENFDYTITVAVMLSW